jgi:Zn-dependent metalloprotease
MADPSINKYKQSSETLKSDKSKLLEQLSGQCLNAEQVRSTKDSKSNIFRFVGTEPGKPISTTQTASPEAAARAYLGNCGVLFGIQDASSELETKLVKDLDGGRSVVRFQQKYQGIPVFAGEMLVQMNRQRNILSITNETLTGAVSNTIPDTEAAVARQSALQSVAKHFKAEQANLRTTDPELWIYDPALIGPASGRSPMLVWKMEVHAGNPPLNVLVLVDAQRGGIALEFNQIDTIKMSSNKMQSKDAKVIRQDGTKIGNSSVALTLGTPLISVYTMNHSEDDTLLPGTLVCTESNPSACNSDPDAQDAYQYALDTYNYYASINGRDSINGSGMRIISSVHYGTGYQNAFWNGTQMVYGDEFSSADDVVGHELTHGVTDYESSLIYFGQSGAINESFSDLWGEFVDQTNGHGTDGVLYNWQMGEDLTSIGVIRNMADPTIYGDPDKITSPNYFTGLGDSGGVHYNSGVNNKAVYLMADGGTFNGYTITGLGLTKVAKIYYETQTNQLLSGSDYFDLYEALYQGCLMLVGTSGITSADCLQVRNATLAVEMNLQPAKAYNIDTPACSYGQAPSDLFYDGFEAGVGNFTAGSLVGSNDWYRWNGSSHTGAWEVTVDDVATVTDSYLRQSNSVYIPSGAYLQFFHYFDFDYTYFSGSYYYFDGGIVEYSTNGGFSWVNATSLFDYGGYNSVLQSGNGNPLEGEDAFGGYSQEYIASRLNLSSLAGQNVMFRWRQGTDISVGVWGWDVDDIRIYTCVPASNVKVHIGGQISGEYSIPYQGSTRQNYVGVDRGPVKVASTNNVPIISAIREAWAVNGVTTSFFQMMGLPQEQLSDTYVFPGYNNVTLNEQLRIANVDSVSSTVTVTIGGVLRGTYTLLPNEAVRVNYPGLDSGPVVVEGDFGVKIISAIREAWAVNGVTKSFVQLMGLPKQQLSDQYVFPGYNNVTLNEQLRIGNVDTVASTVTVTIGGVLQGTYTLYPPGSLLGPSAVRVNYAGVDSGPVIVQGTTGVKIISAIREAWAVNGVTTSFAQLMGMPSGQLSNKYVFPGYNNVTLNDQLRIGNVDSVQTTVTVTIGGVLRGTYTLYPPGSLLGPSAVRVNYAGVDSGPVVVEGSVGVKIISAIREAWAVNGVTQSFTQLMGLPSGQLSSTFWFPAYNNVTLNEQLRIAVP